jgi:glyoxylase-like metal-dependent hydrolase (beta-lactamase superfamily II)
VYTVIGPDGALIVDAGTGAWLDHVAELPKPPVALVCTHFFRDHSAGAARAARLGIPVYVPEGERAIFTDPAQHFRQRDTYIIYDNYWDLFAPIEPTAIAGVLRDYDHITLAGLDVEVVPLPGVTLTQVGLSVLSLLPLGERSKMVFCGEAIHSPGKLARVAPLQYNYNDLGGAVNAFYSARDLRAHRPDALLPSLGTPMLGNCDAALAELQDNLTALCAGRPDEARQIAAADAPMLEQITPHVWRTTQTSSVNTFVISQSGKALAIDYGYHEARGLLAANYSKPYRRRALLHSLDALRAATGIVKVDVVLISHFHDDHVCGVPMLQRLHGAHCWAGESFADLLEQPEAHCFPCDWPQPMRVDRRLPAHSQAQWEEYTFRFAPMNGHTRFSHLIGFEADGVRFAHTGDQYFFREAGGDWANNIASWRDKAIFQNHVYRNGALLDGYRLSADWLREWQPHIVLNGHQGPFHTDDDFFALTDAWADEYVELHRRIMPMDEGEAHFNLDSWGGWVWPYRTVLSSPAPAKIAVTVRNPLPHAATLDVRLVGPHGWCGTSAMLQAEARAEVTCELEITPDGPCTLQPFAVELSADGQPFGQVAEGLMSVDK